MVSSHKPEQTRAPPKPPHILELLKSINGWEKLSSAPQDAINEDNPIYPSHYQQASQFPGLSHLQQTWVYQTETSKSSPIDSINHIVRPSYVDSTKKPVDMAMKMDILRAPTVPVPAGQPFKECPLQVHLRFAALKPVHFKTTVKAHLVDSTTIQKLEEWVPQHGGNVDKTGNVPGAAGLLVNEEQTIIITCDQETDASLADGRPTHVYTNNTMLDFSTLIGTKQATESSFQPSYLIFAVHLSFDAGTVFFTPIFLPIVVYDPHCNQSYQHTRERSDVGSRLLYPQVPAAHHVWWHYDDFCEYIHQQLDMADRTLTPADEMTLAYKAGYYSLDEDSDNHPQESMMSSGTGIEDDDIMLGGPTSMEQVEHLKDYIAGIKLLMETVKVYYVKKRPQVVCGIAIGREEAESLLEGHIPGTFLIRFGEQLNTLTVSHVNEDGRVGHIVFPMVEQQPLQNAGLEDHFMWINTTDDLQFLLDPSTCISHPSTEIFNLTGDGNKPEARYTHLEMEYQANYAVVPSYVPSDMRTTSPPTLGCLKHSWTNRNIRMKPTPRGQFLHEKKSV